MYYKIRKKHNRKKNKAGHAGKTTRRASTLETAVARATWESLTSPFFILSLRRRLPLFAPRLGFFRAFASATADTPAPAPAPATAAAAAAAAAATPAATTSRTTAATSFPSSGATRHLLLILLLTAAAAAASEASACDGSRKYYFSRYGDR